MPASLPPLIELLDLLPDAVCVVDSKGYFLYVSASFERILGYTADDVLNRQAFHFVHPDDRAATQASAMRVMDDGFQRHFRNRYVHKDGHAVDIQWSARWLPDYNVRIGVARDVTELRVAEEALEHSAGHDPLTGLPNRHRLQRELRCAVARAAQTGEHLAVLYLDLDGFKAVNDRGGHHVGDGLLRDVARRLTEDLQHGHLVARVGGDEFVALLPNCRDAAAARAVADAMRARLAAPYPLLDGLFHLDASVGIACFPADATDPDALISHADRAMYAAKRARRKRSGARDAA